MPFGSPGKTISEDEKRSGPPALIKLMAALTLLPIFHVIHPHNALLADTGMYTALMLFFFDAMPFAPLEGKRIFMWNKGIWITVFLLGMGLLYGWLLAIIPSSVFNIMGIGGMFVMVLVLLVQASTPAQKTSAVIILE